MYADPGHAETLTRGESSSLDLVIVYQYIYLCVYCRNGSTSDYSHYFVMTDMKVILFERAWPQSVLYDCIMATIDPGHAETLTCGEMSELDLVTVYQYIPVCTVPQ